MAVISSYCTSVHRRENVLYVEDTITQIYLLALYPMEHVPDEDTENNSSDETENFNSKAHIQFSN